MPNQQGEFIWYELMTPDIDGARSFYGALGLGMSAQSDMPGQDYRMIAYGQAMVGGAMELDADMLAHGAAPMWLGYIAVADVDAAAAKIVELGGHLFVPPRDIPGVGRFAMAADPQGAPFYLMRGASDEISTVYADGAVGHWGWNELWTPDPDAALAFYGAVFGWRQEGTMPMGPAGDYRFIFAGETRLGAIGPRAVISTGNEVGAGAFWRHYFRLPSIDAAIAAIGAQGGTITDGPHDVPDGDTIIVGRDPQGAQFALVGKR
jgi:predicted enzyme related to lactoylglutathione lyase